MVRLSCALLPFVGASIAFHAAAEAPVELQDAQGLVQKNTRLHVHSAGSPKQPADEHDEADGLDSASIAAEAPGGFMDFKVPEIDANMAGHMIDGLIKMMVGKKKVNGAVVKKPKIIHRVVPQTKEEKTREPGTRTALRANIMWFLRQIPSIPAVTRGAITSYITNEMMAVRRTTHPKARALMDNVFTLDLSDVCLANLHLKTKDFIGALDKSGFQGVARSLSFSVPVMKLVRYISAETVSQMNLTNAAILLRDLTDVIPDSMKKAHTFLNDVAQLMDGNAGKKMTASQLLQALNRTVESYNKHLPVVADSIFVVRDLLLPNTSESLDVVIQGTRQLLIDENMKPLGDFLVDTDEMIKTKANVTGFVARVAQLLDEMAWVDSGAMNDAFGNMDSISKHMGLIVDNATTTWESWSDHAANVTDHFLEDASVKLDKFSAKSKILVRDWLENSSIWFTKAADVAKDRVKEYSGKATVGFDKLMDVSRVGAGVLSQDFTVLVQCLLSNATTIFKQLSVLAEAAVETAVHAVRFFACNLKIAREVIPECASAGDGDQLLNFIKEGPMVHFKNLKMLFTRLPGVKAFSTPGNAVDAVGETAGELAEEKLGEKLGLGLHQLSISLRQHDDDDKEVATEEMLFEAEGSPDGFDEEEDDAEQVGLGLNRVIERMQDQATPNTDNPDIEDVMMFAGNGKHGNRDDDSPVTADMEDPLALRLDQVGMDPKEKDGKDNSKATIEEVAVHVVRPKAAKDGTPGLRFRRQLGHGTHWMKTQVRKNNPEVEDTVIHVNELGDDKQDMQE